MTVLSKEAKRLLDKGAENTISTLRQRIRFHYDTKKLALLFMEEFKWDQMQDFYDEFQADTGYVTPTARVEVKFKHPIVGEIGADIAFNIEKAWNAPPMAWPKGALMVRADADDDVWGEVSEGLADYVQAKCDLHVYTVVVDFIKNLKHVEEMRYYFPPILRVFRRAGLHDIANKLADVRRAPTALSPISNHMRLYIKHANQWAAVHEMLGTFDTGVDQVPRTNSMFTLDGNIEVAAKDADGTEMQVVVCS